MANINIKNKTDTKSKSKYIFLFQHLIRFLPPKQTTEQTFYINLRYKNRHIKNYRENVENTQNKKQTLCNLHQNHHLSGSVSNSRNKF